MKIDGQKTCRKILKKSFQPEQFFLVAMINIILLTVDLTIFNICFFLLFVTTVLKFYKTHVMEKHVDLIEIPSLSTHPKTSIIVHLFSIILHDILLSKALAKSIIHIVSATVVYFLLKWVPFYAFLIFFVNVQYLYQISKRIKTKPRTKSVSFSNSNNEKSTNQSTVTPNNQNQTQLLYFSSSLKPTRSTLTEMQPQISQNLSIFSQSPRSPSHRQMNMIEEVEQDKILDQDIPQISTIHIVSSHSSFQLS